MPVPDSTNIQIIEIGLGIVKMLGAGLCACFLWALKDRDERAKYVKADRLEEILKAHRNDMQEMWDNCKTEFATKEHCDGGMRLAASQLKEHSSALRRLDGHIMQLVSQSGSGYRRTPIVRDDMDDQEQR